MGSMALVMTPCPSCPDLGIRMSRCTLRCHKQPRVNFDKFKVAMIRVFDSLKEIDDAEPLLAHLENHVLAVRLFASRNVALSSFHRAQCVLLLSDALHLEVSGRLNEHFHRGPHYNCMFPYG